MSKTKSDKLPQPPLKVVPIHKIIFGDDEEGMEKVSISDAHGWEETTKNSSLHVYWKDGKDAETLRKILIDALTLWNEKNPEYRVLIDIK